jgi:phosphoribosylpyrophosphate synthetase
LIVLSSPDTILQNGSPKDDIVAALKSIRAQGVKVGLVSNHGEPHWFSEQFPNGKVKFATVRGRQRGDCVKTWAARYELRPFDILVLAGKLEDMIMSKNGGAVTIAAGWSTDEKIRNLGIKVRNGAEFEEVVQLTSQWPGEWWYSGNGNHYDVKVLADLSTMGSNISVAQGQLSAVLTRTVKNGGARLIALLTITARSLLMDGLGAEQQLLWGLYPASQSQNNDSDVLSDFTHRLRTTVSKVKFAERDQPLFLRHAASEKRSGGGGGNRTDPKNQIETVCLNPFYRKKIQGRHVVVVDDCTTYGISFAVASAFLKKAGAAKVTGVALGKFGNCLQEYGIVTEFPHAAKSVVLRRFLGSSSPEMLAFLAA